MDDASQGWYLRCGSLDVASFNPKTYRLKNNLPFLHPTYNGGEQNRMTSKNTHKGKRERQSHIKIIGPWQF